MTGPRACFVLVSATYASLVLDKRSGSDDQGVPAPLGKAALERRDSLENALIEQGRIEGDSQATMGYSRRLYRDLFIILNLSSQAKYKESPSTLDEVLSLSEYH